jgi:hypothetical protein
MASYFFRIIYELSTRTASLSSMIMLKCVTFISYYLFVDQHIISIIYTFKLKQRYTKACLRSQVSFSKCVCRYRATLTVINFVGQPTGGLSLPVVWFQIGIGGSEVHVLHQLHYQLHKVLAVSSFDFLERNCFVLVAIGQRTNTGAWLLLGNEKS